MGVSGKVGEGGRGRKRIIFIAVGFVFLAAYLYFVVSVIKNTDFVTLPWLKLYKNGVIISPTADKRKIVAALLSALLAIPCAVLSMIFISGRGHRGSVAAGAVTLSLIPLWRLFSIFIRWQVFCRSSIGSEGIRERFVKNSFSLEVIVILLIVGIGAVAFFSRRASEYGDSLKVGGKQGKKRERTLAGLSAKGYLVSDLILTVYDGRKTAIAIYAREEDYESDLKNRTLTGEMKNLLPEYDIQVEIAKP